LMKQEVILFQPGDAIRGVYDASFQYYLKNKMDSVVVEILEEDGDLVQRFVSKAADAKGDGEDWWGRGQAAPTSTQGLNTFIWTLRYTGATVFDGMIIWGARPQSGPKAPVGKYQVRLTAGSYTKTYPFQIKMNPNLSGVTEADLKETFDLAVKIRNRESEANEAVIKIRKIRSQLEEGMKSTSDPAVSKAIKDFIAKITVVEEDLYQTKNRSGQDPLNFPIKLGNRISAVRRSLETGEGKPTAGVYKVFDELSKELDGHLTKLNSILSGELPPLNQKLNLNK
jgi:hypothetical protein